jgi:transporter family-2 protein
MGSSTRAEQRRALPWLVAFAVGLMTATQARINGQLSIELDSGLDAATVSFSTGLLVVVVLLAVTKSGRTGVRRLVKAVGARDLRPWQLIGGFLGAYFVWAQSLSVPVLGVALFSVAVVAGQTSNSLIIDRLGIGAAGVLAITPLRFLAGVMGLLAVVVSVLPRLSQSTLALGAVVASVLAGALVAFQQAINGRVSRASGSSWAASGLNFVLGACALMVAVIVVSLLGQPFPLDALPPDPWLYLGGPIGVAFIAASAWVVPMLGVLRFALSAIAGQLSGALAWDLLAPTSGSVITPNLYAGLLLAFLAVVVSARR